jgi:integrase
VDPHGPRDLRHTFATWLEDGAVPARVIDELMGHQAGRRGEREGSMICVLDLRWALRRGTIPAAPRPGHEVLKETTEPR